MKTFNSKIIKLSFFLVLILFFGQTASSQEDKCVQPVSIGDISERFKSDSGKGKSVQQTNEELINEIVERKVNFKPAEINEKTLKKAGATDLLLKTIRENPSKYPSELGCWYQKYVDNYQSDDPEKLKIALEAAKEYARICESKYFCNIDELQYFKEHILKLERAIKSKSAISSQGSDCSQSDRISVSYILSKFIFTSRITKPAEPINEKLVEEIIERKVNFRLDAENKKSLKEAGASDLLLKTISENYQPGSEIEAERLYHIYMNNYQSNKIENLKMAIDAAKEFVKKFEKDGCYAEQVKYFKDAIPMLEPDYHPPRDPKIDLKWKLLAHLTDKYKAKNWNEIFALGEKVLEIDPEFTPLIIVLAGVGFDQAKLKGEKSEFNDKTIRYAELAVKLLEAEKETQNKYGALDYEYKTKAEALEKMKQILDFMKNQNL